MKRIPKQEGDGDVRAYVDLSALYPSDPMRPAKTLRDNTRARKDCAGGHCEKQAVREALDGWRWI